MDLCLVSGGDVVRLRSSVNHHIYADLHALDHRHETGPFSGLRSRYYFKLRAVQRLLPRYAWVVWMDDDAFVTDFGRDTFRELVEEGERRGDDLVVADGRVRDEGPWTVLNTGVFLLRNSPGARTLIDTALGADLDEVRAWWRPDDHGYFTNGDQDAVLWAAQRCADFATVRIVPHASINARPYHYDGHADDRFVCHFPGVPDKQRAVEQFGRTIGRDDTLVPQDLLEAYAVRRPEAPPRIGRRAISRVRAVLT